ncbi:MAG: hydantoinase/oxoprolinase family protein [Actinobacteria bacterium]|nr:hydantoinase/oxoprolinase family protein [Actinomycetota bacterium]
MGPARAGIDVGGTFTDGALIDGAGELHVLKVPTDRADLARGSAVGLAGVAERAGLALGDLGYVAHGTTVATNALVEGALARAALVTTAGFRDVLAIGTQQRPRLYDLQAPARSPLIPRERCYEVRGRLAADGSEVEPLDADGVRRVAGELREAGVEAVAVVLLFSFVDRRHEDEVAAILRAELPGVPVTLSVDVAPEFREYHRANTTALNAVLLPLVGRYVRALSAAASERGVTVPVHLMQSNGGVSTAQRAGELPAGLIASGPAAAVIGAARQGDAVGEPDLVSFDMGGTTADVAVVLAGRPLQRFQGEHDGQPVNLPQIDVLSIGAGGGSIASVDEFGALAVGPRSAGARPGPAAYGHGGTAATVTDAHVVTGVLRSGRLLGTELTLDGEAAAEAVRREVADPLGLSVEEGAAAILRVANANMAQALRAISVARGHDPRALALVAMGGAGPMHACDLAEELGIPRVVVPRHPGVGAALGLLLSDVRHDVGRSWLRSVAALDPADLDAELGELERRARELLEQSGHGEDASAVGFELEMRYQGQAYNLTVPLAPRPVDAATLAAAVEAFEEQHRMLYRYTPAVAGIEIVTLRAQAVGDVGSASWEDGGGAAAAAEPPGREIWQRGEWRPLTVLDRGQLAPGQALAGPAVIEQEDTTILVNEGWTGAVHASGALRLVKEER